MTHPFAGFSSGRERSLALPIELFTEVLAQVRDLAELKVLLTVFRLAAVRPDLPREVPRAVRWEELRQDEVLRAGLAVLGQEQTPEERLDGALERAVARGTLLHLAVPAPGRVENWYLVHTEANRRLVERPEGELAGLLASVPGPERPEVERPTIYALYEQNIGMLTPLLTDDLAAAAQAYPAEWIEEAFREAVAYNKRSWRYVRAILERWAVEGRGERPAGQPIDFERYTRGEYADLFGTGQDEGESAQDGTPDEAGRS